MNKHSPGKVSWERPIRKQGQYFALSIRLCFFKTNVSFHIIIHPINIIIHSVDKHDRGGRYWVKDYRYKTN